MTQDEIRAIAQQAYEEVMKQSLRPRDKEQVIAVCTRFLSAIAEKAEPVALYPCGFKNLHSMVIETGAFLARSMIEEEPVKEMIRSAAMVLVGYAKDMSSLLAKQPLYTHPAIEPAPSEFGVEQRDKDLTAFKSAAPLPDEVAQMVKRLRQHALPDPYDEREVLHAPMLKAAADMIERLAARVDELKQACDKFSEAEILAARVPDGCVVVPREPTEAMVDAANKASWAGDIVVVDVMYKAMIAAGEVKL